MSLDTAHFYRFGIGAATIVMFAMILAAVWSTITGRFDDALWFAGMAALYAVCAVAFGYAHYRKTGNWG